MKYLKPFNENIDNFKEELQDFCENNLAYLLDEGEIIINFEVKKGKIDYNVSIKLEQPKPWNEIKDQVIPFLTRLIRKYNIKDNSDEYAIDYRDIKFYLDGERHGQISGEIQKIINNEEEWYNSKHYLQLLNVSEFRFVVDGYKQETKKPKSILTKIKSFFK